MAEKSTSTRENPMARTEAVEQGLAKGMRLVDIQKCHAKHSAVGGDQGQIHAQHPVKQGAGFANDHFSELDNHRNH